MQTRKVRDARSLNTSRRLAISRALAFGSIAGVGIVAGLGGYLAGLSTTQGVDRTLATTIISPTTVTQTLTVRREPELRPVEVSISMAAGGRGVIAPWLFLETDKELAEKYALKAKVNLVAGSGQAVADLVDKRADLTGPGDATSSIVAGIAAGAPIKIVYFSVFGSLFGVIASNSSGFKNIEEVRQHVRRGGKIKIGYSRPGAPSHQYMWLLEDLIGGKVDREIEGLSLGSIEALTAALDRGEIDLWIWSLDLIWRLENEGRGRAILAFKDLLGADWHEFAIATRTEVLQDKEKLESVVRFIAYWRELVRTYLLNEKKAITLMTESPPRGYGMAMSIAEMYYHTFKPNYLGAPNRLALEHMRQIFDKSKAIPNPPIIDEWYTNQLI